MGKGAANLLKKSDFINNQTVTITIYYATSVQGRVKMKVFLDQAGLVGV